MSTDVWPPIAPSELAKAEAASLANELQWLLQSLQNTLQSLKAGLEECAALLAPTEPGSTLVMSSHKSEAVKGVLTRVGTRVVKGSALYSQTGRKNIQLRLQTVPPPRGAASFPLAISSKPQAPTLVLDRIVGVRTLLNSCLDIVDTTMWTGDAKNADFISGQLRLLEENIREAKVSLKGGPGVQTDWWQDPVDPQVFDPPPPPNVSLHVSIFEAALVLVIRTLAAATPRPGTPRTMQGGFGAAFSFRDQLAIALGGPKPPVHDEVDETFTYNGDEVSVREKVRVESQDPSLMAALAKLGSLERVVRMSRQALAIVMGKDIDLDDD